MVLVPGAGGLFIPLAAGILLRDVVTLIRVWGFGWRTPVNGGGADLLVELVMAAMGAFVCCRVASRTDVIAWLAMVIGYCILMPPLRVFDPFIDRRNPVGLVSQDVLAVVMMAAVWWIMMRRSANKASCPDPEQNGVG